MVQFDGLRPARLKVGVISAGRVGTALGVALERAEHVVVACSAISEESRRRARRRLPDSLVRSAPDVAEHAELLLLAVPDTELAGIVSGLAATGAVRAGTIVVHTSGATGIGVLAPLTEQGCLPLAVHPAMTFTGSDEDIDRLSESCFGVTAADEIGYAIAEALTCEIGGEPFRIDESARTLYHAALCHGGNHVVTVIDDALTALRAALPAAVGSVVAQDPDGIAERVLGPLVRAAVANTLRDGRAALTGPVARGDSAALARHLAALTAADPDLAETYRSIALRTAHRAGAAEDVLEVLAR
ncbi:DUF2520 domain-containing protein [[Mycobacterium] kokjensenii]|uniref:DUF2520 domain-containing protein n=1 Tax=[Mycobacterium] kokjensenii TaxID=3064287 RepID=A0ABN9NDT6_9MYCO|nr:DUF2520 domain-containing protein [Mycolicibacter sp. MU0083]CAJ1504731.1 DUF2520 domain-containing protein [Mycolicibacter sp. MU0083]